MDESRCNFTLHFAKTLEPEELVRNGWEIVPLEVVPVNEDHNPNVMGNPDEPVPPRVEFCLTDGEIEPGLSSGRRDEIYSICLLPIHLCAY